MAHKDAKAIPFNWAIVEVKAYLLESPVESFTESSFASLTKEPEIRRFGLGRSQKENRFSILQKGIINVFPELRKYRFKMFYADDEEDKVGLSTLNELRTALSKPLDDDVFRVFIEKGAVLPDEPSCQVL